MQERPKGCAYQSLCQQQLPRHNTEKLVEVSHFLQKKGKLVNRFTSTPKTIRIGVCCLEILFLFVLFLCRAGYYPVNFCSLKYEIFCFVGFFNWKCPQFLMGIEWGGECSSDHNQEYSVWRKDLEKMRSRKLKIFVDESSFSRFFLYLESKSSTYFLRDSDGCDCNF